MTPLERLGIRERRPPRRPQVLVCIPTRGSMSWEWVESFTTLGEFGCGVPREYVAGEPVHAAREELVQRALDDEAEWIFFLDDDVIPEDGAARALIGLRHAARTIAGADIVSGLYYLKGGRTCGLRWKDGDLVSVPLDNGMQQLDVVSFGLTLIRTEVFRKLPRPWFAWTYLHDQRAHEDEAVHFSRLIKKAGIEAWLDPSVRATHLMGARRGTDGKLTR